MDAIFTLVALLVIFSLLVFVHELGHFLAAKLFKVPVEEFALGFGPVLWQKNYRSTTYRFNLIPLGGYVKLKGEDRADGSSDSFSQKSFLAKAVVLLAGIIMNLLLACGFFSLFLSSQGFRAEIVKLTDHPFIYASEVKEIFPVIINEVIPGAAAAGKLNRGDVLVSINDNAFGSYEQFKTELAKNRGKDVLIGYLTGASREASSVKIRLADNGESLLGVMVSLPQYGYYQLTYPESWVSAIAHTYNTASYQFPAIFALISKSIEESDPSYAAQSVSGVVGVSAVVNDLVVSKELSQLVNLVGLISVSLALVNLLPLPILDGGQLVISGIEALRRKRLSDQFISRINFLSFVFIIILTLVVTLKDLWQFEIGKQITDFLGKVFGI